MCCNSRESFAPGDDDDDDDDNDTSDMSICNIQATDDEVAEIFRKHISHDTSYDTQMICQYAIYKLQMMKLLKYSNNTYSNNK